MTATCGNRYRDAVGAALDCDLPPGHDGEHASRTTPDTTYRWSAALGEPRPAPQPTADASAPDRDRTRLLHLLGRLRDGRLLTAEVDLLADAVTALAADADARRFGTHDLDICAADLRRATERAERAEAAIARVREAANRPLPITHAADSQPEGWARGWRAATADVRTALDGEQPTEPVRCCVCGTTDVAPRGYGTQRYCWPCTLKETFAEPEPTEPRPLVISIDLNGADIANLIRRAFRTPGSPT